ncbi:hypothetical protein ACRRTK_006704 [Alexandromys fortis]
MTWKSFLRNSPALETIVNKLKLAELQCAPFPGSSMSAESQLLGSCGRANPKSPNRQSPSFSI